MKENLYFTIANYTMLNPRKKRKKSKFSIIQPKYSPHFKEGTK